MNARASDGRSTGRPNILIILSDQLRRQALGCYGDTDARTPHIDRLARDGVRFQNACSTYPICVPFRFTFMTGEYAHTRLVPGIEWAMSPAERTLADELNEAGYDTAWVGKWHLDGMPLGNGFDHSYYLRDQNRFFSPNLSFKDDKKLPPVKAGSGFYGTTAIADNAIEMLEELLSRRITETHGQRPLQMGGAREAAEIINSVGKVVEKHVMGALTRRDKLLARRIEEEMFKFEHLFVLDPQSMGALLRDVANETLIDALKGISEEEREVFFRAMSSRAADGVRDEIAARGRVKLADVVNAQKEVVAVARKLAADGTIAFGAGDDDYV